MLKRFVREGKNEKDKVYTTRKSKEIDLVDISFMWLLGAYSCR